MSALEAGEAGRLRVGTFQSVGAKIIPRLLRGFSDSHPQVDVMLHESQDESELLELIERGNSISRSGPFRSQPGRTRPSSSCTIPTSSSCRRTRPLATLKRPPTLKEIVLHPIIGFNRCSAMDHVESQLRVDRSRAEHRLSLGQQRDRAGPCRSGRRSSPSPRASPSTRTTRASRSSISTGASPRG